ncbi:hypothetical protein ACP4OV_000937 [Aristida adscensionis]
MAANPYLALDHVAGSDDRVFFSFAEQKVIDGRAELKSNSCWATPQGWVLVRDATASSTYLLDPHNHNARIGLPHLPEDLPIVSTCVLSDHSFTVLLVKPDAPVIWYCRIDDEEWTKHEYDIGTQDLSDLGDGRSEKLLICPITACRGKFYFNGTLDELGVLDFCPAPVFGRVTIPGAADETLGFQKLFMVESKQDLYRVSLLASYDLETVYRVTVHRFGFAKQEWIKVDDLGDQAFLLSSWYFGASRSADQCGLEKNCVYMLNPWDKCVKLYNIKDGTDKVLDLKEAPASDHAMWMLPTDHQ